MYAYCLNNPIIFGDPYGQDAIILLSSDGAGHLGIMVQDESGVWWHFYWGPKKGTIRRLFIYIGRWVKADPWCEQYSGNTTLEDINNSNQYSEYEDMYYFEGDFSQCVADMKDPGKVYNVFLNNCSQVSFRILADADTVYKDILSKAARRVSPKKSFLFVKKKLSEIDADNSAN